MRASTATPVGALTHPTRVRILRALAATDEPLSPLKISKRLREPLGNVAYHTRILINAELIVLVDTAPRRGATEHFYRPLDAVSVLLAAFDGLEAELARLGRRGRA